MGRSFLFLFFVLWVVTTAQALTVEELAYRLRERGLAVNRVKVHMVHERSSVQGEKVRMEGIIWIERPDRFRMDVFPPHESITVLKGDQMLIYFPEEKVAQRVDISKDPSLLRWVKFLQEPWEVVKQKGRIEGVEGGLLVVEIDTKDFQELERVRLWIDQRLWFPKRIEMVERGGEKSTIFYSQIEINPPLPEDIFELHLPPDVQITEF